MNAPRRSTLQVLVGGVPIGGDSPVVVQSMTNTDSCDAGATLEQIARLAAAGCEIIRVAVPRADALSAFARVCAESPLPVVADIHFDHHLAIEAARLGAAKLRVNPGNIGGLDRFDAVLEAAGEAGIPVRIGVNAGSLATEYEAKDWDLADKLVASAVAFCDHAVSRGFENIVVSAKASSVRATVDAYRKLSDVLDHPLHLGVTEAGTLMRGTVKSSVGLGILLDEGIGDTMRVSLTADPVEEVSVAWDILSSLDLRRRTPELVSCPTCGRCEVDLIPIANEVSRRLRDVRTPLKVAVMGCVVNGPGESRDADIGVAAGRGVGIIFARGRIVRKVPEAEIVDALFEEIAKLETGS